MRRFILSVAVVFVLSFHSSHTAHNHTADRQKKLISLFSVVQFPNQVCTTQVGTSIYGTCLTSSECTTAGGSSSGTCAAGFGVCCYISTSTCSTTIQKNNTYITNPSYPSSYTPALGSCTFTISKINDDICQLRFDFQTFTGFSVSTVGVCTDTFTVTGQTGVNPPSICGTNTGYHMYAEVGKASSDTGTVTITYGSTTPAKQFNIFVQQIECDNPARAPTDCVQYFTGVSGNLQSYGHAGGQLIKGMDYTTCIRTEKGYCGISYVEASGTTIDAFSILAAAGTTAISTTGACAANGLVLTIPRTSSDGITGFSSTPNSLPVSPFPNAFCGALLGIQGATVGQKLTTVQKPFTIHLLTAPASTIVAPSTGYNLEYAQVLC